MRKQVSVSVPIFPLTNVHGVCTKLCRCKPKIVTSECRQDADVIDETWMAYKSIDAVMEAQRDLVDIVHSLREVVCVKGSFNSRHVWRTFLCPPEFLGV